MADPSNPFSYAEQFNPSKRSPAAPPTPVVDPVTAEIRRQRDLDMQTDIALSPPPDQVARASRLARQAGVPPVMVEDQLDDTERSQNAAALVGVANSNPGIGQHLAANPRTAVMAQDDHKSLGMLGSAWDFLKKAPARLVGSGGYSLVGMGTDLFNAYDEMRTEVSAPIYAAMSAVASATGIKLLEPSTALQSMAAERQRTSAYFRDKAAGIRDANRGGNVYTEGLLAGTESVPLTVAALATRSPTSAATVMGTLQGGSSYAQARQAGQDIPTSLRFGINQGVAEGVFEAAPASSLLTSLAKHLPFGKTLGHYLAEEMPNELATQFVQSFSEWQTLNPGKSSAEWVAGLPAEMRDTALGVVGGGALTVAAAKAAQHTVDVGIKIATRHDEAQQAQHEGVTLDRFDKAAQESKLRQRDPEAFRAAFRDLAEQNDVRDVHLDGQAAAEYLQSDSYDAGSDPFSRWHDDAVEAAQTGTDLVIPIEDAITDLAGTPAWAALKDDMRLSPGGVSPREAQTFSDAMGDHISELSDKMDTVEAEQRKQRTVIEKLTDTIAAKLGDSYTAPAARTMAEVTAQYLQTRAARSGVELTGDEVANLDIKQVMPEALAAARNADATDLVINALRGKSSKSLTEKQAKLAEGKLRYRRLEEARGLAPGELSEERTSTSGEASIRNGSERDQWAEGYYRGANSEELPGSWTPDNPAAAHYLAGYEAGRASPYQAKVDPMRAAADELNQLLEDRGLDPAGMSDDELRTAIDGLAQEGPAGGYEQEARGRIQFDSGKTLIELFQARNLSTYFHEFGHMALENLATDASMPDAPDSLKADWQTVQDWFAAQGQPITDGIPVEAHELWARGFERYLMEGKAPSQGLKRIFETVRSWMVSIYKTIDRLKSPITPEIREVMDRLIATDEEIEAAREHQGLEALFKDAASVGMSDAEFASYGQQVDDARAQAYTNLVDKTLRAVRARTTRAYNETRKGVREEIAGEVMDRALYRALTELKASPLSEQWIVDNMGQDALALLPKRVPPLYREGGAHPDGIAELAGYGSGREMVDALIGADQAHRQARERGDKRTMRERTIETETDAEMNRRHGDPLNDGSIEREALAAVSNEMQGEVIASEIRVLARKTGQRPTPYALARDWARQRVRSGRYVDEASPAAIQRHARNAAKASRAAEQAMLKQDTEEAFRQKQFQMLNNALLAEASAAQDDIAAAKKRLDRVAAAKTLKSVDQDYLEQAQALLEQVELRDRSQRPLDKQASFSEWAAAREAEGFDVVVLGSFAESLGQTHWTRLPVDQLLALDETVKQIMHLGRFKQTLLDNQERREFDAVVGEAVSGAGNIKGPPPKGLEDPGHWDAIKGRILGADAALLKMETVFDWLDGGDPNGVFNRIAFRPVAEAQAREQDMLKDYYARIKTLFEAVPDVSRWNDKVPTPFTDPFTGKPLSMSRQRLIAMALNIGNAGNLQRLSDGYGWNAGAIEDFLTGELTADEWQFVQGVWDTIDTLWPKIEAMEKRINGVAPDKIEARSFSTPHGEMKGGYYPAIYDGSLDLKTEERRGREADLFEGVYTRASTRASATKSRADKVRRPILLDVGVINRHLGEVIHDVTHREAVMQAHKFLTNERVASAVDQSLGPEIRKAFRPWVKHVANSWAMERAGNEGFGKWIGKLRANATAVGLGLRATTMVTQIAGYSNSTEVVGEKWMAQGIAQTSAHPIETFKFVMAKSDEVRHRMDTLDRDLRTEIARIAAKNPASKAVATLDEAKVFMFHGIGLMDRAVAIPTWIGAYNKAVSEGMADNDASYAADKAVRVSQGAGAPKDLAAIQRGTGKWGEALKLFTMFYSYFSAQYQRQRTLARDVRGVDARKPRNMPRAAARAFWLLVVPPLLVEVLKMPLGAGGPDDDEEWGQWVMRKILANAIGPIPLARDVFEPAWNKAIKGRFYNPAISPIQRAYDSAIKTAGDAGNMARGEATTHATKDIMETVGYATGLVPGQLASATQFLVDVGYGEADPQGFSDWVEGLTSGRLKR